MTSSDGLQPYLAAAASAAAVCVFMVGAMVVACKDDGSSLTGVDALVLYPDVIGGGTECQDSLSEYTWVEEQHVQHDSTDLLTPGICWEYTDSAIVSVEIEYAFLTQGHIGWHTLRLFHKDCDCYAPANGEGGFEVVDSAWVEDPLNQHFLGSDSVTLPASPGCAIVVLHESGDDVRGSSDNHAYVRLLTKLDRPEDLTATFNGSSVDLIWQNTEPVRTEISRSPGFANPPIQVDSGVADFADSTWSYGTTHAYWVRHRWLQPESDNTRVSDWSDSVTVSVPDSLTVYIFGDTIVPPADTCSYTAVPDGGSPQYGYLWSGDAEGSSQVIWQSFPLRAEPYMLIVMVTDSLQWEARDTLEVQVSKLAPGCHAR